jgi:hemerythrin superfamily protein
MTGTQQNPDLIAAVRRDHREIEQMIDAVESTSGGERREALDRLVQKLKAHETAEEEVVHPLAKDEGNEQTVGALIAEETAASRALAKLEGLDTDSRGFDEAFASLKRDVLAHAQQEERDEHPRLAQQTPNDELARRGAMFEKAENDAAQAASH